MFQRENSLDKVNKNGRAKRKNDTSGAGQTDCFYCFRGIFYGKVTLVTKSCAVFNMDRNR